MADNNTNEDQTLHELQDVEVDTVGLVTRGANRKRFFLLKSQAEENTMADEEVKTNPDADDADTAGLTEEQVRELSQEAVEKGAENAVIRIFKGLFASDSEESDEDDNGDTEVAIPVEVQKKLESIDVLMKAQEDLKKELAETRKALEDASSTAEEREFLAKADGWKSVGADRKELAEFMVFLSKANDEKLEWFENFVKGIDAQLAEAGIYAEFGSNNNPEQDDDPIEGLIKSGEAENVKDAYIKLGEDQEKARTLLRKRRTEVRTG